MKTSLLLALYFFVFLYVSVANSGETFNHLEFTTQPNQNLCGIGLPAKISKEFKNGRLIVWLHGGMNSARKDKGKEAYKAILPFLDSNRYHLISPSAFGEEHWLSAKGRQNILASIDYMLAHYPLSRDSISFIGVSDGCLGVIQFSKSSPYPIHKRLLISSFPQIAQSLDNLKRYSPYQTGYWIFFQGAKDRLFPPEKVIPYLQQWKQILPNTTLYIEASGEHDFSWWSTNRDVLIRNTLAF